MLIRFLITNFLSFDEETEFNMLASSEQKSYKDHIYTASDLELLKVAALYGANGAGKSNFIKALAVLKTIVQEGGKEHLRDLEPHKLSDSKNKPTTLEIEFINGGIPFLYGVSVFKSVITEEWLYESGLGRKPDQLLFHRELIDNKLKLEFANNYVSTAEGQFRLKFYQNEFLKGNSLLFTELAQLKEGFGEVKKAFDWFTCLLILFPHTKLAILSLAAQSVSSPLFKKFSDETISTLQTGISEVETIETDLNIFLGQDNEGLADEVSKRLQNGTDYIPFSSNKTWGKSDNTVAVLAEGKPVVRRMISKHQDKQGQFVDFSLDEESDGTNRLLDFIPAFYGAIHTDSVVFIDEIDQSIHPALLKELVRKFVTNTMTKGQLVFTTHESNLLDQSIFRRDEIWFSEKHEGATKIYPLSDFDIRLDLDIRKGYLNGRFGAIPFTGNLKDLNWDQYAEA